MRLRTKIEDSPNRFRERLGLLDFFEESALVAFVVMPMGGRFVTVLVDLVVSAAVLFRQFLHEAIRSALESDRENSRIPKSIEVLNLG